MKKAIYIICLLFFSHSFSQSFKKSINALKITNSPKIDGLLNESFWKNADEAKDFIMFKPSDGGKERNDKKTIVKVVYDDEAIYIGAIMYDETPDEIPLQFGDRDNFGIVDYFLVSINPNNDNLNDTEFFVMSTGAQADAKVSLGKEIFSWNAVWDSEVRINKNSWVAEIKIPYSALRFSNTNVQTWGINFRRKINKLNEEYSWNYIDKKIGYITQYNGKLEGIVNIKPPTRLSFSPYTSGSYTTFEKNSEFNHSIGLDLKYGINESFTLDATLIPDFGQTAFDDQVLNLTPFEQRYEEKRAFFTEGTSLFNKGSLFYSRRIGNTPTGRDDVNDKLNENEVIVDNPSKVNMLNAIKLSGRTKNGLGIGVFNAITEKTSAKIKNELTSTNEVRSIVTEPTANYNVLVLDQQFNKNSSISLVNTNVLREGNFRDANATALLFDISDKYSKYIASGYFKASNVFENNETQFGHSSLLILGKTFGNVQYDFGFQNINDTFDISDLGYQQKNNYSNYFSRVSYRIFVPTKTLNFYSIYLDANIRYQNKPYDYSGNNLSLKGTFETLERFSFGSQIHTSIGKQFDFYEPRTTGRYYQLNPRLYIDGWFSSDYRKKFALDFNTYYLIRYSTDNSSFFVNLSPRFRFSNKFSLIYSFTLNKTFNEKGYVNKLENESIIFGNRERKSVTNTISGKLSFNTKSSLGLSFRYYWSPVQYDQKFYELDSKGTLINSNYSDNHDINYNIWDLDLSYSWEFAPGSQLVVLYRNSIFNSDNLSSLNFRNNLNNLFKEPDTNNFSLKLIYYLDYNNLKNWL